jgi:hypothetical protein
MAVFQLILRNNAGAVVEALEGAIANAEQLDPFFGGRGDDLSREWAKSRETMFLTRGASNGTPWPGYTRQEQRYYLPRKRAALYGANRSASGRAHRIGAAHVLRFTTSPESATPGPMERLYPSMARVTHSEYVWERTKSSLCMGTAVPYAAMHDRGGVMVRFQSNYGRRKSGTTSVSYPLPQRRLIVFGAPFTEAVRKRMAAFAAAAIADLSAPAVTRVRAGLTTRQVLGRIAAARGGSVRVAGAGG